MQTPVKTLLADVDVALSDNHELDHVTEILVFYLKLFRDADTLYACM